MVMGVFLYLYSPFLDHWLGNEVYARPHTHTHFSEDADQDQHDQHEEGFLCFLDIDMLLALLLAFNIEPSPNLGQHLHLIFKLAHFYFQVSLIELASPDPPPNI